MGSLKNVIYKPNKNNKAIYDNLYSEFCKLYDYFGRGKNNVMKNIKYIKE